MSALTPLELTRNVQDISVTERNAFKTCRRRWYLETILNLQPKGNLSWALEFGTGIHSGLESYYLAKAGLLDEDPKQAMLDSFEIWFEEIDESIVAAHLGTFESAVRNELLTFKELGEIMLWNYHEFASVRDDEVICCVEGAWTEEGLSLLGESKPPYDEKFHPILHKSGRFLTPILEFSEGEDSEAVWMQDKPFLSARLDLIIWKRQTGKRGFWIRDHKTAAQAPNPKGLDFDDQVTGYGYTFWRHTGIYPRGTEFNFLIKNVPSDPRILQNGSLSTAKDQLTLPSLYRKELENQGLMKNGQVTSVKHFECYESLLAHGWDRFFQRHESPRNQHEYLMFESRLPDEHEDMLAAKNNPERKAYPHLSQYVCQGCSVGSLCQAIEDGSDFEFIMENSYQQAPDRKA